MGEGWAGDVWSLSQARVRAISPGDTVKMVGGRSGGRTGGLLPSQLGDSKLRAPPVWGPGGVDPTTTTTPATVLLLLFFREEGRQ